MVTASVDARQDELRLAVRLLARKLASLHACILTKPDGGCADIDVDACDRGCVSCWRVWAEMEAGRLRERRRRRERERRRRRERELEQARAGERRRPEVPVVPEDMDLDSYMARYGAD